MIVRTVAECTRLISECDIESLQTLLASFAHDDRAGVRAAVQRGYRRLERHDTEIARLQSLLEVEDSIRAKGFTAVAGADEVGRGALAGPLSIGIVIFGPDVHIPGIDDSKKLTPQKRSSLAPIIRERAVAHSVVHVHADDIDSMGMTAATRHAILLGLDVLSPRADHIIVDGLGVGGLPVPETPIVAGDSRCAAVAAASIIAKVDRDALMIELDREHPGYDLALNKGYGTAEHISAIGRLGPSPVHRRSFAPCRDHQRLF